MTNGKKSDTAVDRLRATPAGSGKRMRVMLDVFLALYGKRLHARLDRAGRKESNTRSA